MQAAGITHFRDEMLWKAIEKTPGKYVQPSQYTNYISKADAMGLHPTIELGFGNSLYDKGLTPYTDAGRNAFANYAVATLKSYGGIIDTVEIWNEYNGGDFVSGPAATDRTHYYTLMLKEAYTAIKKAYPDVTVVGGSTVLVPLPYLNRLFDEGALKYMDAVSVHPYRQRPEGVEKEIAGLQKLMAEHGGIKPIYATEFGRAFDDPNDVPGYMVKMATLMASVHVTNAYWYPLRDNWQFDKMGLFDENMNPYPALSAFQFLQKQMPDGVTPERVDVGSHRVHAYELDKDTHVVWGLGSFAKLSGNYKLYDAAGTLIDAAEPLAPDPIYVKGNFKLALGRSMIFADTELDYDQAGWSYFARNASGKMTPLVDGIADPNGWNYHRGLQSQPFLTVSPTNMLPGNYGVDAVQRFILPESGVFELEGSWSIGSAKSNGVLANIVLNNKEIWSSAVKYEKPVELDGLMLALKVGDVLDIGVDAAGSADFDNTSMHVRLNRTTPETSTFSGREVRGTAVNDALYGTKGSDIFFGGAGNDRYASTHDGVADVFVFTKGTNSDRIFNFEPGIDRLDLTAYGIASFDDPGIKIIGSTSATLVVGTDRIVLNGIAVDVIKAHAVFVEHPTDYLFV